MQRKRKPLSQLTLDEVEHGKKSRGASQNENRDAEPIQARAGTVARMVLKNFMCHSHLEVTFDDNNIHYIIGRNGSGKSAILTALIVGLSGKASLTNRGNSIKSFIKVSKSSASVEITLRNNGPMAYKYDIYGKEITIIRNFTSKGASSYKIKSAKGEIITNKFKEIQLICNNLNIQIDNPLCLLNQDTSRNFLSSKDPNKMFILFMRATHLQNLLDEYQKLCRNKEEAFQMLEEKKVLYQQLSKELQTLRKKIEDHKSINMLKDQVKTLQIELFWAKVNDSEKERDEQQQEVQKLEEELNTVQDQITNDRNKCSKIEEKIQVLQQKINDLQESIEFQNGPQNALVRILGDLKDTYNAKRREKYKTIKDIEFKTANCNMLEKEINTMKENTAQKEKEKMEHLKQIADLEEKLKGIEGVFETSRNEQFQIRNSLKRLQEEKYNLQIELQQIDAQIGNTSSRLKNLRGENSNILSIYGQDMPKVIEAIKVHEKEFVHLPKGPLGSYITVRDKKWAVAVEGFVGSHLLRAFAVDNKKDNELLMKIFQRYWRDSFKPMVITSKFFFETHDVRSNIVQPVESCISVYSALEISDPVVANCLIDQTGLESVLLIPDTNKAIALLSEKQRVPKNCKQGITIKGDRFYPDPNYKTYGSRYHTAQFLQVSTADIIRHLEQQLQDLSVKKNNFMVRHQAINSDLEEHEKKMQELEVKIEKLSRAQILLKRQYDDLQDVTEFDANNVHSLESELSELLKIIDRQRISQQNITSELEQTKKKIEDAEQNLEKIKTVCRGYEDRIEALQQQMHEETRLNKECQTNKRFIAKRFQQCQQKVEEAHRELNSRIKAVQINTEQALKLGERVDTRRTIPVIMQQLTDTEQRIVQIQSDVESAQDVMESYQRTNEQYKKASEFMKHMCEDIVKLEIATKKRGRYYKHTEDYFVSYVKHAFRSVLEFRQFQGSIEIDMQNKKLELIVIPQQGSQGHTATSNLSGGERSFSTVAFLYSLWQCMEFPFYFLDEFDVFMDKVNRTKVMEILLDHAKSHPDLQFVFLTPQDVSFVKDRSVSTHRLEDPERSQINTN